MSRPPHLSTEDKPLSMVNVNFKHDDIFQFLSQTELEQKITETSLFNDFVNDKPFNNDLIRCYALKTADDCFGIRVNTTLAYCAANQKVRIWIFV